jgi:hypothetical protein
MNDTFESHDGDEEPSEVNPGEEGEEGEGLDEVDEEDIARSIDRERARYIARQGGMSLASGVAIAILISWAGAGDGHDPGPFSLSPGWLFVWSAVLLGTFLLIKGLRTLQDLGPDPFLESDPDQDSDAEPDSDAHVVPDMAAFAANPVPEERPTPEWVLWVVGLAIAALLLAVVYYISTGSMPL